MFKNLASDKLDEYNKYSLDDWKQAAFAVDSRSNVHTYLKSLEDRREELSARSDIPKKYDNHHNQLIKETASVSILKNVYHNICIAIEKNGCSVYH